MILSVPVYVEKEREIFTLRPLFGHEPSARNRDLSRATSQLTVSLDKRLTELSKEARHDALARLSFCPDLEERQVKLTLFLRRHTLHLKLLLVAFRALGRRIAFSPRLEGLWFAVERGESLRDRATEVYTDSFLKLEAGDEPLDAERFSLGGRAWITTLDVDFRPRRHHTFEAPSQGSFFLLGGTPGELSGSRELSEVGRCLDWLYPHGLKRAFGRDAEVEEVRRVLAGRLRRPVLLVGPPKVGKTSVIHEVVYRSAEARRGAHSRTKQTWLIAPGRLIAGMSFVGQWEQRVLAIVKHARKMRHVLCFDDLLGLFRAGISAQSNLSVGHMIKPFLERREVSVLAEITPEQLGVLREVDRGFADLFHIIRLDEPDRDEVLSLLIRQVREIEGRHGCELHPAVLPLVIDLQRRYARQLAFPGKAAVLLERLAVKFRGREVTTDMVLEEFHRKSGLALAFLSDEATLDRRELIQELEAHVKGQTPAVEAMADAVSIGKARLQDPSRPLASLLFLGPTGVGKTQSAKALARYLFGDASRILRFDMNELGDPGAPGRLVGTFHQPGGQLTTAVQHNPFAVVLLDEIEKAHPEVFNLLLQVLDDGRLTDALGRTADFTNAIVILTSNLGADEARRALGFAGDAVADGVVYTKAAEAFFRPELFNRLDRIIPFAALSPETIEEIASQAIREVFAREGLRRRRSVLTVDPAALEAVAREGYQPLLGARALKRVIERRIARPVARRLAGINPELPTLISVVPGSGASFEVELEALEQATGRPLRPGWLHRAAPEEALARLEATIARLESELEPLAPSSPVPADALEPAHQLYFAVREQLAQARERLASLRDELDQPDPTIVRGITVRRPSKQWRGWYGLELDVPALFAAQDVVEYLREVRSAGAIFGQDWRDEVLEIIHRLALGQVLLGGGAARARERVILTLRIKGAGATGDELRLPDLLLESLPANLPLEVRDLTGSALELVGPSARRLAEVEAGTHLVWRRDGSFALTVVEVSRPGGDRPGGELLADLAKTDESSPRTGRLPPIIRSYIAGSSVVDHRTGLLVRPKQRMSPEEHRPMLLSQLPLPAELEG